MYDMVKEFHEKFGHPVGLEFGNDALSQLNSRVEKAFRMGLIHEETFEVEAELLPSDKSKLMDKAKLTKELSDLLYVTLGMAITFGLPIEEVFKRVHESNMSKLDEDGKPIYRKDGKVLKGPNYKEPDLGDLF